MTLKDKILNRDTGLLFYSFSPPKITTEEDRVLAIAGRQREWLSGLDLDGLILYDIQDESSRTNEERTYPFIPTIAPEVYCKRYLTDIEIPKIIYKSIANHRCEQFTDWLNHNTELEYAVFVGASSQQQIRETSFSLSDAYALGQKLSRNLLLGGVAIPERHSKKGDEHHRIFNKKAQGCRFFISQCVYNLNDTKNLLSDYYYSAQENGRDMAPIIFTLAPCGSLKTLQFMQWLGIQVPQWLYNDLKHSKDILEASIRTTTHIASEILDYARTKNIPVGFNIESISMKKEEIEASGTLLSHVADMLRPERGKTEFLSLSASQG